MKRLIIAFSLSLSLLPDSASAQVSMQISIGLPVAPPLVVIQPGVQVVEDYDEEVFFVGGWYWCRRGDLWYRARRPHASYVYVEPRYVPTRLSYLPPPGHYKHWHRRRAREERRWWREHDHDRRRAWREHDARRSEWRRERERDERHRHVSHRPVPSRGPAPAPAPSHHRESLLPSPSDHRHRNPGPLPERKNGEHRREGHGSPLMLR